MKVLVVGSGGREHALAWKLSSSPNVSKLYCAPGNPGTAECSTNVNISDTNIHDLVTFAKEEKIDLVVIGPENPLFGGLADRLGEGGIRVFGPTQQAAMLESDKAYCKELMRQYSVPTAESRIFTNYADAKAYIASRDEPLVIKASGPAMGKGVIVCEDPADALRAAEKIMVDRIFGESGDKLVVEEKLTGQEVSVLALVDGRNIYVLETAQDHKAIGEGDTGPNTGGMGAYSPVPFVTDSIIQQIERQVLVPIVDAINRSGTRYNGVLYAGLMLTTTGPKVLEFNTRFGDPETQPIMMRLKSDLFEALMATAEGKLDEVTLEWDSRPSVCVVMASGGYPGKYDPGMAISGIEEAQAVEDVMVFHAGTTRNNAGRLVTFGGRVLGVTTLGETLLDAKSRAYTAVEKITFDGAYYRKDISDKAMVGKGSHTGK
ncbi:MAG: phosphoribosylamine--glycine ligase [Phycisphaerae bacterium]|jgi:phosphoribosylamine--glycine ligase|nr:phosphoribosylamine--glycine ligase [Phycisphaerae bacterium]